MSKESWNTEIKESNIFAISGIVPTQEMKCSLSKFLEVQGFSFLDPVLDLEELANLCMKNGIKEEDLMTIINDK